MDYSYNYETTAIDPVMSGAFIGIMIFYTIFMLAMYIYLAIVLMKIAKKTNTPNNWFAWIPFLNLYLMVKIAKKPGWWFILMLIPFVNIIIGIIIWMAIAKRLGHPEWLGILVIVPIANIIIPGYLAFAKKGDAPVINEEGNKPQQPPSQPTSPPVPKPEKKESTYDKADTIDMD